MTQDEKRLKVSLRRAIRLLERVNKISGETWKREKEEARAKDTTGGGFVRHCEIERQLQGKI